ncbi:JAB domain-containing protein [Psychroserpens sp.]|uniref:JAB domain-containing protein n=1 Tax=Psychroserpens sp. TaxID=2020870 RepID=UPI002B26ADE3|nr:JAB domain-containing protein [Psychroserpens sp.]
MKTQTKLFTGNEICEIKVTYERPPLSSMPAISCSLDAIDVVRQICEGVSLDYQEHFWCIFLNNSNHVLGYREIGRGDQTGAIVHVSQIFAISIKVSAKAIILAHNHPSGKLKPSKADKQLVGRIEEIGKLFNISILDSIIITSESSLSFADEGLMNKANKNDIPF